MELTEPQKREQAIQRAIVASFPADIGLQVEALTAALARIVRSRNHLGGPLSKRQAGEYARRLANALTDEVRS